MNKRNVIAYRVRSHYRHKTHSTCAAESLLHKAAKHAIVTRASDWNFSFVCCMCRKDVNIEVVPPNTDSVKQEVPWKAFRLDVAVSCGGQVTGAVEVVYTSPVKHDKVAELNASGLAWCEVTAQQVMRAYESKDYRVRVDRCAKAICR